MAGYLEFKRGGEGVRRDCVMEVGAMERVCYRFRERYY